MAVGFVIVPFSGKRIPATSLRSVVFPAPLGPMQATIPESSKISRLTALRAGLPWYPP